MREKNVIKIVFAFMPSILVHLLIIFCLFLYLPAQASISQVPLFVTQSVNPLIMLSMSNDHQLYFEAYPDYADLTGDGAAERKYNHDIDYYGYFDSYKCYDYVGGVFEPHSTTETKYCGGNWSGNFLNYVTMTRIDVIRKILYGGYRSTDTSTATVLERSYLPNDAHSWVRYYDKTDIELLTPFSLPAETTTLSTTSQTVPSGSANADGDRRTFTTGWNSTSQVQVGDQLRIRSQGLPETVWMIGVVRTFNTSSGEVNVQVTESSGSGTTRSDWEFVNESRKGVSFCNTTVSSTTLSQNVTDLPLIRVASGNYSLWTANERWQCRWDHERNRTGHNDMRVGGINFSNGNNAGITGVFANSDNPIRSQVGLGSYDYNVQINVCVSEALQGKEQCKMYPDGNLKPSGLLQKYGDDALIKFGLVSGSYVRNKSGGVLRRNPGFMSEEINVNTDGTFKSGIAEGIIQTLDKFRIYGYRHDNGEYFGATGSDNCSYTLTSFTDGQCTNWGNPQSEIFLEVLRYFSGASPYTDFSFTGNDRISGLAAATWSDPLSNINWCAPLSVIAINSSIASYDDDQYGGLSAIGVTSISTITDIVGSGEEIHNKEWFVGKSGSTYADRLCSAKSISNLGNVEGICPEAPGLKGTYHIAGLAHYAYTESIRNDLQDSQNNLVDVQVKTYGVEMAPAVPSINIPFPGTSNIAVQILPACENTQEGGRCALVDFKIIDQDYANGTGSFLINWDAAEQGGDYDMDMNGILSYVFSGTQISVTTNLFAQSSGRPLAFGYIISGTTQDGFHAHSGINSYSYTDISGVLSCNQCRITDSATTFTYTIGESVAGQLQTPLYYAAKWGGYYPKKRATDPTFPQDVKSWDRTGNGLPDNYYYAIDPAQLAEDLESVFLGVVAATTSAVSVVANSVRLDTDTHIYQARFRTTDWSGELIAYSLNLDGSLKDEVWEAGKLLTDSNDPRNMYTFDRLADPPAGIQFLWSDINETQKNLLNVGWAEDPGPEDPVDYALGEARLNYIRGVRSGEEQNGGVFRERETLLGDIINSDPVYVAAPNFGYHISTSDVSEGKLLVSHTGSDGTSTEIESYAKFRLQMAAKPEMIYVGSNAGMLHGFRADTGQELLAYVPDAVISNLHLLTDPDYTEEHRYFVDGPPRVGHAYLGLQWRTILVGTTGAGGRSVFALDVTDPETFSAANVLWEITPESLNSVESGLGNNLGYTIGQPTIARLHTGDWVAIFGNGYDSPSNKAQLFVVNLATGGEPGHATNKKPLILDTGAGTAGSPNGLSTPTPVDATGNRITDYVYAGDLLGNLWKFDLTTNRNQWGVAYKTGNTPKPLISLKDRSGNAQPVTARPAVGSHESGIMIYVGTGKFFEAGDNNVTSVTNHQSFYGILDSGTKIDTTDRSQLQEQQITHQLQAYSKHLRVTTQNSVDYNTKRGWYMDLVLPGEGASGSLYRGERVVSQALLRHQRIIFTTLIPSDHDCDFGGTSWLMELSATTGGRLGYSVFDLNLDNLFTLEDYVEVLFEGETEEDAVPVSGLRSEVGIIKTPAVISAGDVEYKYFSGSSGEIEIVYERAGDEAGIGRQSWRQLR